MKIITLLFFHKKIILFTCVFTLLHISSYVYGDTIHKDENNSLTIRDLGSISDPPNPLSLTIIKIQDATSTGICCDGKAKAIASGGKPGYTYQWSASANNQTTEIATLLTNRIHSVTVTDANGTKLTRSIVIQCVNPCQIKTTNAITDVLCTGDATGAIDLTVNDGTPPYTFAWNNGSSNEDLTNVIAGRYTVTITDANNCVVKNTAIISEPQKALSVSIDSKTDIACEGLGQITSKGTGGTPPYSYSIDNGVTYQANETFLNLPQDNYTVTIKDANNCTSIACTKISFNCTHAITDINNTFVNIPVSGNVLTNDFDLEGDTQTVTTLIVTTTEGIEVAIEPNTGIYTYTPPIDFIGVDTFEYTICDNGSPVACDTATVYIEVLPNGNPKNNPPIANPDTAITEINTPVNGNVLTNDFDPDGDPIKVTTTTVTTQKSVIVIINPDTGTFTYTPINGYTGEDSFEYTICDNGNPSLCDTTTVTITIINNQNNSTFANDDAYFIACDNISDNVLDNDFDPEGDTQIVNTIPVDDVDNGTLQLNANGTFIYTPNIGFTGTDSFIYSVCDDNTPLACDRATVYFTVSDFTPPDLTTCNIADEIIECDGENNETIATIWNSNNILELESCVTNICNEDFTGKVTSDYDFNNLISTCGQSGSIEVTYTITDKDGDATTLVATLTLLDTTPPSLTNCEVTDITLPCSTIDIEETASQWNADNIVLLESCANDNCNASTTTIVTSDYDFDNLIDETLSVEYTITDDCGNTSTINAKITLENNSVIVNDRSLCALDEVESQIFDLFDLLEGDVDTSGIWEVTSGNTSVIDDNFFDPLTIELVDEDDSETVTFSYTIDNSVCPIFLEAEIEVHNRCAVLTCGGEGDIKISKVITPNGDSFNEYFLVKGVEDCGYTIDVKIINRWGAIIYKSSDYQNDWNGIANQSSVGSANQIPSGTYYCIVTLIDSGLKPFSSPLYIGTR
ncbi:Ig-like domain-containing protein [Aquimarina algiphila]|uniref:Tandem-95 repeat protein n=1 Tax=Aquimarina algiphila TaxID=2047982 RepID=A0A554VMJ4_9FLAO|nr:Ig-like domain-containing protein [Aquimarina algiphila]TSE09520.1 tandem-95 repeat protein [Aquimarina algiphila]